MDGILFAFDVDDARAGLGTADENTVLPFGKIHVAYLLMVEDGGKIHAESLHRALPMIEISLAVGSTAGSGVVVELTEKCASAFV